MAGDREALPGLSKALRRRGITLRPATADDGAFLRRLYRDHRADEMHGMPWPEEAMQRFLDDQFDHQQAHFEKRFPDADFLIVLAAARRGPPQPIGRLYVDRSAQPWRLIDILLSPDHRNGGAGAELVGWLTGLTPAIDLHVALDNARAEALYRRLGFRNAFGALATHRRMIWTSEGG